jgi:hypothetical protein
MRERLTLFKNSVINKALFIISIITIVYWWSAKSLNVYKYAFLGAIFELFMASGDSRCFYRTGDFHFVFCERKVQRAFISIICLFISSSCFLHAHFLIISSSNSQKEWFLNYL